MDHATKADIAGLRGELHAVRDELRDEFRGELHDQITGLRGELYAVRDELRDRIMGNAVMLEEIRSIVAAGSEGLREKANHSEVREVDERLGIGS
jgi:hypothetical protein